MNVQVAAGARQVCFGPVASHSPPPCRLVTTTLASLATVTNLEFLAPEVKPAAQAIESATRELLSLLSKKAFG